MQMLNSINNIRIAKYFNLSEFTCPCCNLVMLHPRLLEKISRIKKNIRKTGLYYLRIPLSKNITRKLEEYQTATT